MIVIGLCIGFIVGNIVGVVLMALIVAAGNDSRRRESEYDLQGYESNN